jgi:ABC-2 type transport system ATP-binding protein
MTKWSLDDRDRVGALSVGQRQKLAVILAMGHHPELLVLDEPVASLDPVARRQFLQSLIEFTADEDNTILFSTHITSDLERVASHVAFLEDGKIGFSGELDELKQQVKRLRISAAQDIPAGFEVPGMIRSEIDGNFVLLTVREFQEGALESLSAELQATVTVEDLNLEEIFLELAEIAASSEKEVTR